MTFPPSAAVPAPLSECCLHTPVVCRKWSIHADQVDEPVLLFEGVVCPSCREACGTVRFREDA